MDLSANAWENRYLNNDIGWDLGEVSTPLKAVSYTHLTLPTNREV